MKGGSMLRTLGVAFLAGAGGPFAAGAAVLPAPPVATAASGGIEGTVTLPSGGGAANICVSVHPHWPTTGSTVTTRTASDGRYHVDVYEGDHVVEFEDCGNRDLVPVFWPGRLDANEAHVVTVSGAVVSGINQVMTQGGEISGKVVDLQGNPIVNAQVGWEAPDGPEFGNIGLVYENSDGSYVLHGVAPGSWRVVGVRNPDYPDTWSGNTDDYKSATLVSVSPGHVSTMNIDLPHAGTISGHVVDEFGQPWSGA